MDCRQMTHPLFVFIVMVSDCDPSGLLFISLRDLIFLPSDYHHLHVNAFSQKVVYPKSLYLLKYLETNSGSIKGCPAIKQTTAHNNFLVHAHQQ